MRGWTLTIFALCTVLAAVAATPTTAQTTTYDCSYNPATAQTNPPVCIDEITAVIGTSAGGDSIIVHWREAPGGANNWDFYQIQYAYPGSGFTQVKLGGGAEGTYNLVLQPTADPNGDYTFKVQGCFNNPLAPASCSGWNVETYTISGRGISTSSQGLTAPPPPQPPQNLHTSISTSGDYIQVLWNNPPGVLHATVTRTPTWPSASSLNVPPASGSANLKDILIVSGQRYSYNVCLNYQAGNLCGSVTGELPGPHPINGQITQHPRVAP